MAATINLYPPIVDTYMPAFLINSATASKNICRVYFSLSQFNTVSQIKNVQVAIRNSSTNLSALNTTKYPSQIMIKSLQTDINRTSDDKYYIDINPSDMINENFVVDQYYRVQMRFTSVEAPDPPISATTQPIDEWLAQNLLYFSEWSTICLIRGISVPSLSITNFTEGEVTTIYDTIAHTQVVGSLTFEDGNETETLKSYQIKLYDENNKLLLDSGIKYTNNYTAMNEINYTFNYSFEAEKTYYFTIDYTTANLYSESHLYNIQVESGSEAQLHVVCRAWPDEENGCLAMKILRSRAYGIYTGQIIIRRTDSKSNFTIWEDMLTLNYNATPSISEVWHDYTIESGIWYKYAIQGVDTNGMRSSMITFKEPVMVVFQHMYLVSGDKQLKIAFDPSINSIKQTISEAKIDATGSKYPYIKRNGYLNYAEFSISGTINSMMDEEKVFTSREEIYQDNLEYYNEYNEENSITEYNDLVYERFFRDKVRDFLNSPNAKLFRSPTEGNYLVRLMSPTFTPNQTLGRNVYSFSCNASEIDECNIDNYEKYGIITRVREG